MTHISTRHGILAISPILVFLSSYVAVSVIAGDFYKMPLSVALIIASAWAVIIMPDMSLHKKVEVFSRDAGSPTVMYMVWIFILAGAFAALAREVGAVESTVNIAIKVLPAQMLVPGLFVAACFISLSIGTSVGTVVALSPLAVELAQTGSESVPFYIAVVLGGAFFGDNLSFISDTTIVSTSTQECKMSDKFKVNSFLVMPAAFLILIIYILLGNNISSPQTIPDVEYTKVIPYIVVLITAVCGLNVMAVLVLGISLTGLIGLLDNSFDTYGWFKTIGDGITGMGELIIITMLAGGMLELIKVNGGIDYIIKNMTRRISGKRGAELSIAALVSIVTMCTANNTVAIITVGGIARRISQRFGLDNRKCASILDTMSCFTQGLLPYGAHLLLAAGIASTSPMSLIPYLYYPFSIGAVAVLAIIFRYPKRYS